MAASTRRLTRSVEDYLKAIYSLSEQGESATTNSIAAAMDVQPASVTGMVKRLAESGLLEHAPYRGVHLTPTGEREALRVLRRHRILETYLTRRLGYRWDDVHVEAERLEHAASDDLIDRMAHALEDPSHDPHGAPIPTSQGEIERTDSLNLFEAPLDTPLLVRAVRDDDGAALRALEGFGLLPGVSLVLDSQSGPEEGVTIRVGDGSGGPQTLHPELAARVFVTVEEP